MNKYTIDDIKPGFVYYSKEGKMPLIAMIISEIDQNYTNVYFFNRKIYICTKNSVLNVLNNPRFCLEGIKVD